MTTKDTDRRLTILRTAAGSSVTVSQNQRLRELGARVVAADCDPLSVGLFFADAGYTVPRVRERGYLEALLTICAEEHVDVFLPSLDEELVLVAESRKRFEKLQTQVIVSPVSALRICTDKLATYRFFSEHNIPTVRTLPGNGLTRDQISSYPQIVKPRHGRGSTGVHLAHNWEEVEFFARYLGDAVVQPRIEGVELTIDVLASPDHEAAVIAPRCRISTDSGLSYKGRTLSNDETADWTRKIVRALQLVGPANIQCFMTNQDESILFTEVNARLAGTSILSDAAGAPLYEGIYRLARGLPLPQYCGDSESRVMVRYWSELFISVDEAEQFGWSG